MPRFFIDEEPKNEYFVGGENGLHLVKSLRIRTGEEIILCAETGKDFICTVTECKPDGVMVKVEKVTASLGEPSAEVTVCQCWPKGDKLETVVQKSVELGAKAVWPIESARCVSRPDGKAAEKKVARMQKIALEAAKQSGRGAIPKILPPTTLKAALQAAAAEGDILFCYEGGTDSLKTALKSAGNRLFVFIGPEGGFSPEESALAESMGARLLTLGPRILRTETAPLAALAAIFYERGDFER